MKSLKVGRGTDALIYICCPVFAVVTFLSCCLTWQSNLSAVSVEHCDEECDNVPIVPLCYYDQVRE